MAGMQARDGGEDMSVIKVDTAVLDRIVKEMPGKVRAVGMKMAHRIEGRAKVKSPFKTGANRNSIDVTPGEGVVIATVGPHMEYSEALEFGHLTKPFRKTQGQQRMVAARPYLTPAVMETEAEFMDPKNWEAIVA
jgi:hypothetical protein